MPWPDTCPCHWSYSPQSQHQAQQALSEMALRALTRAPSVVMALAHWERAASRLLSPPWAQATSPGIRWSETQVEPWTRSETYLLSLLLSKPDAFSLSIESDWIEAYLACIDLSMFTFQKMSFQDNRPDLALLDPQVQVHPEGPGSRPSEQLPHPQQTHRCRGC